MAFFVFRHLHNSLFLKTLPHLLIPNIFVLLKSSIISLFLLIFYVFLIIWDFSRAEYYHPILVVFHLVVIFLLFQAILGMRREKLIQISKAESGKTD